MKIKPLTFLLALTFLLVFSGSVYGDDLQDGLNAYDKKDYKIAYKLILPLAEQGDATAQYNLGVLYDKGQGVPQDYKESVKWIRLSAEQGNSKAQFNMGLGYRKGQGVPQDYKEAVKWFRLSAEQGFLIAQYSLGVRYHQGEGVPQDYKEAVKWYRLSAEQGYTDAQFNLGVIYYNGDRGVSEDYVLAHMWWNICGSHGGTPRTSWDVWLPSGSTGDKVCVKNKNLLENKMTPEEIEKAQEMARNWKPKQESKGLEESTGLLEQFKEKLGIK